MSAHSNSVNPLISQDRRMEWVNDNQHRWGYWSFRYRGPIHDDTGKIHQSAAAELNTSAEDIAGKEQRRWQVGKRLENVVTSLISRATHDRRRAMIRTRISGNRTTRRVSLALVVGLMLAGIIAGSAAASSPSIIRDTSSFVSAYDSSCVDQPEGGMACHYLSLHVSARGSSWDVCGFRYVDIYPADGEPSYTEEYGCATVTGDAFTLDHKLQFASLDPVTVTFFTYSCTAYECSESRRQGMLAGDWTGYGNLIRFNDRFSVHDGKCKYTYSGKGERRDATAVIMFDGAVTTSYDAVMGTSKTTFKTSIECA